MWFVYFEGDSREQYIRVTEQDAAELVKETSGELKVIYIK